MRRAQGQPGRMTTGRRAGRAPKGFYAPDKFRDLSCGRAGRASATLNGAVPAWAIPENNGCIRPPRFVAQAHAPRAPADSLRRRDATRRGVVIFAIRLKGRPLYFCVMRWPAFQKGRGRWGCGNRNRPSLWGGGARRRPSGSRRSKAGWAERRRASTPG